MWVPRKDLRNADGEVAECGCCGCDWSKKAEEERQSQQHSNTFSKDGAGSCAIAGEVSEGIDDRAAGKGKPEQGQTDPWPLAREARE